MINDFGRNSFVTHTTGLKERIQKAEKEDLQMNEQIHTTIGAKKVSTKQLYCRHTKLVADESIRMLYCERCGIRLDPFEFLMNWAQRKVALHWHIDELERKKRDLYEEIEILKKGKQKARRNAR